MREQCGRDEADDGAAEDIKSDRQARLKGGKQRRSDKRLGAAGDDRGELISERGAQKADRAEFAFSAPLRGEESRRFASSRKISTSRLGSPSGRRTEMVAIAGAIIRQRTGDFDPSTYRDRYQSGNPAYWARPSVPLGYNEPVWPARAA